MAKNCSILTNLPTSVKIYIMENQSTTLQTENNYVNKTNTLYFTNESFDQKIINFGNAISSPVRLKILRQLSSSPLTLIEVAKLNNITNSTALFHLKILQEAEIVAVRYLPGKKGKAQVFFLNHADILLTGNLTNSTTHFIHEQSVGVGYYVDAKAEVLNVATFDKWIRLGDRIFSNDRFSAQLLWTDGGSVSYAFENFFAKNSVVQEINFSLEICSEARFYRNDWKSDISFSVNGVDLATYTSPGDFGGVRGKLNPAWWGDENTQYGTLINLSVKHDGTYVNDRKYSEICLKDLKLNVGNKILFTVYNKENAEYYGGFNIFGKSFGNHPQDIVLTAKYTLNK